MNDPQSDGRIEARVSNHIKRQYRKHAERVYGMKLATWLKMLAHRDYSSHQDE